MITCTYKDVSLAGTGFYSGFFFILLDGNLCSLRIFA